MTSPFPVQPYLTAIALAYRNESLIADAVMPRTPVNASDFKYMKYALADGFTLPDTKVGRKSKVNEVDFAATEVSASTEDYGLEDPIPQSDMDNAPPNYDPLGRAIEGITDLIMLDREKRVADLVFGTGNYAAGNKTTLAGTAQWSDAGSDPLTAILNAMDGMVMRPNVLVVGQSVYTKLRTHPNIVTAYYGTGASKGLVPGEALASLLELDEVLVGQSWLNSAKKGQTTTLGRVWGKHAALIRRDPLATTQNGRATFGVTAEFGSRVAGSRPDPDIGLRGGIRVRAGESVKELLLANDLGYLFTNAVL